MRDLTMNEIETVAGGPITPPPSPGTYGGNIPEGQSLGDGIQDYVDVLVEVIEFIF